MRLLIVTQFFWPEDFRINDLAGEMTRRGHEVTVLTSYPNYPDGRVFEAFRTDPLKFSRYLGTQIVRVPQVARGKSRLRLIVNFFSFAASACLVGGWRLRGRKFDAIFSFVPSPVTVGIPGVVLRALKNAPMTLWVLDLWPETLQAVGVVRAKSVLGLVGKLVSAIYNRSDLILGQSKSFVPQIKARCSRPSPRIEYFPGWAESVFNADAGSEVPELPPKDGKFDIMFAGNIGDAQDFPAILAAAERLKDRADIRWLIVGDGRAAAWVSLEIQRRGLAGNVVMVGRHPLARMPAFYRRADVMLVALRDEPIFGMTIPGKVQSYLIAGRPIVAMLNGEGGRTIADSGAGIACAAGDSEALGRAILKIAALTAAERDAMGARGRVYGQREFGRDGLMDKVENWLATVTKAP
jgi:colanic acid biosynthesis glycosyl transferase WcaI